MISKDDIKNLAELVRLELSEEEVAGLQKDISNVLETAVGVNVVSTVEDLNALEDGLYVVEMYSIKDETRRSLHMYVATVIDSKLIAYSQAFSIIGDSGEVEYPIGPHVCSKFAFEAYIKQKQRKFRFHRIGMRK